MQEASHDPQELKAILQGLDSRDEGVRNSVAWKLRTAAACEEELVVSELVRRLCDEHPPVRRCALRTLQEVVPQSCDVVLPLLLSRTGAANAESRLDVLSALQHFDGGADPRVAKALVARLNDAEARVRAKALRCLANCGVRNEDQVVMKVLERLEDVDFHVRLAAAEALPSLADRQNYKVLPCLAQLCRNQRPPPQRENLMEGACLAIAKWCYRGDIEGIDLIGGCIRAEHIQASKAALKALPLISLSGQHQSLELAAQALNHPEFEIRELATEVLVQLLPTDLSTSIGDGHIFQGTWSGGRIQGSTIFWGDTSSSVTIKSKSILLTQSGDADASATCWARLLTPDRLCWDFPERCEWRRVSEEAPVLPSLSMAAMEESAERPDDPSEKASPLQDPCYAVVAVAAQFRAQEADVRKSAVRAIPRVAGPNQELAVELLLPMMQDESADVRFAAVNSLLQVSPKGHPDALAAMTVRLEDQEVSKDCRGGYSVGVSAAKALKKMVTCREELVKIADELNFQGPSLRGF